MAVAAALVCTAPATLRSQGQQSVVQVPQFRAGVELTRLEVRVLDKAGNPLKDLTATDFGGAGLKGQVSEGTTTEMIAPRQSRSRRS